MVNIITSPWPEVHLPECTLWDLVWSNPNNAPDSKAAVIDAPTGRVYTRKDLKRDSQRVAWGFRHKLGLKPRTVVCIFSPNSFYYHMLVLGMQCAGFTVTAANAAYTPAELEHQISDSKSSTILAHPSTLEVVLAATKDLGWSSEKQRDCIILAVPGNETSSSSGGFGQVGYRTFDTLMTDALLEPYQIQNPKEEEAYLSYSSGTSGRSKGVRNSHYNMTSVITMLKPMDTTPDDIQIAILPLNHIYGLTKVLHWPIHQGNTVVLMPRFELEPFCAYVQKYRATVCLLVPPVALLLARDKIVDKYDMSSLKLCISGAAPLGRELETQLAARLGTNIAQAYGLSETSPTATFCPLAKPKPGSIGPLIPMMKARLCDPVTLKDVGPKEEGELWLQGPNVMLGYLNNPEATKETLITDEYGTWLRTGDIAWVDDEGFFFITDRAKELIKYKGFQVAPADLEATLLDCPFVSDTAVIGVYAEEQATELPRAYVVLSEEGKKQKDPAEAVRAWIDSRVARHKKLRGGVKIVDAVPKSPSGKLLRRILRDEAKKEMAEGKIKAKL